LCLICIRQRFVLLRRSFALTLKYRKHLANISRTTSSSQANHKVFPKETNVKSRSFLPPIQTTHGRLHLCPYSIHLSSLRILGGQTSTTTAARATSIPLCRHRPRRHWHLRVDLEHRPRHVLLLHRTPGIARIHCAWPRRADGEGENYDAGEDDLANWTTSRDAGGMRLRANIHFATGICGRLWLKTFRVVENMTKNQHEGIHTHGYRKRCDPLRSQSEQGTHPPKQSPGDLRDGQALGNYYVC